MHARHAEQAGRQRIHTTSSRRQQRHEPIDSNEPHYFPRLSSKNQAATNSAVSRLVLHWLHRLSAGGGKGGGGNGGGKANQALRRARSPTPSPTPAPSRPAPPSCVHARSMCLMLTQNRTAMQTRRLYTSACSACMRVFYSVCALCGMAGAGCDRTDNTVQEGNAAMLQAWYARQWCLPPATHAPQAVRAQFHNSAPVPPTPAPVSHIWI